MQYSKTTLLCLILLVVGISGLGYRYALSRSANLPDVDVRSGDVVPGAVFADAMRAVEYYQDQITHWPEVVENYTALAQVYMQQARATGNESRYIPLAEKVLLEALRRDPKDYHARVLEASLLNTLHQFEEARDLARQLIDQYPGHVYNYGTLVDALVELGEYEAAVATCDTMLALRPSLSAYARASYLRELHGDTEGAIEAMRMAVNTGVAGDEGRAWAVLHLGELYLNENKPDTAAFLFNGLLEEKPDYIPAYRGLAQVHLVKGAYQEAIDMLEEAYASAPNPAFLEALAEAYQLTDDEKNLRKTMRRIQQHYRDAETMGERVDMEYADFLADQNTNLDEALRRAHQEYLRRPNHLHALETYAWALFKTGQAEAAIPLIERARRLNTGDAMVAYRAGMIYQAADQPENAKQCFQEALQHHLHIESLSTAKQVQALLAG